MVGMLYSAGDYDEGPYGFLPTSVAGELAVLVTTFSSMVVGSAQQFGGTIEVEPVISGGFTRILLTAATIDIRVMFNSNISIGEVWVPDTETDNPWLPVPDEAGLWVPVTYVQGPWNG